MPVPAQQIKNWEPVFVQSSKEGIQRAILDITERVCSPADLLQNKESTAYLKLARRMMDNFLKDGTNFIIQSDFDCDGITSAVVWEKFLAKKGQTRVTMPSRDQGHATLAPMVQAMKEQPNAHLVILDNGTNLWQELVPHLAPHQKVLILDHHQAAGRLPDDARISLINPHTLPGKKNENDLSTAGLSYFLLPESSHKEKILAGLGQIGDVMPLTPLSHQIARETVRRIIENPTDLAPLLPKDISVLSLAFSIIPKINAVGRMSHPLIAFHALATVNPDPSIFLEIERQNEERKAVTAKFYELAIPLITPDPVQVIYIPEMPAAVAGLIASRLSSDLFKPVLCLCNKQDKIVGSFRSPLDVDLSRLILEMIGMEILLSGGGHKRAGGVALNSSKLGLLRAHLQTLKIQQARPFLCMPIIPFQQVTQAYQELEPFGSGSPPPFWGIPFVSHTLEALYTREGNRHWANRGEMHTPMGRIPFIDTLKAQWRNAGMALGQVDWDAYKGEYIFRIETIL